LITIVVTTYNRIDLVKRALHSALDFAQRIGGDVVLVDDGSTDGTLEQIETEFAKDIAPRSLRCVSHAVNQGVTAAKNTGFANARGDWVIFLDSDDTLIAESAEPVQRILDDQTKSPIVFFRCIDHNGVFVGHPVENMQELSVARYGRFSSYGEALVSVNKALVRSPPFDAELRGYEGLGCARLLKQFGPAKLAPIVARRYERVSSDRLSAPQGFLRRAKLIARGHILFVSLLGDSLPASQRLFLWIKALLYYVLGTIHQMIRSR
jgi:glycosyltransferase involved in cell wall biosynthesis